MVRTIQAVYENGVFKPLEALEGLQDHTPVQLQFEDAPNDSGTLADFAGIWSGEDGDQIARVIEEEFGRVDASEW